MYHFEQGDHNFVLFFPKKFFSTVVRPKHIRVRDRASLFSLLIGLNGYTVSSGVIDKEFNGESIISVPLAEEGIMHIGYITNNKMQRSRLGQGYINCLRAICKQLWQTYSIAHRKINIFVLRNKD